MDAAEADYLVERVVDGPPHDPATHPLSHLVLTHRLSDLVSWAVTGVTPDNVSAAKVCSRSVQPDEQSHHALPECHLLARRVPEAASPSDREWSGCVGFGAQAGGAPVGPERRSLVVPLGTTPGVRPALIGIAPADARHHVHILGPTGTGKSTLLVNLVCGEARAGPRGVAVFDPKGDLIRDLLDRLPAAAGQRLPPCPTHQRGNPPGPASMGTRSRIGRETLPAGPRPAIGPAQETRANIDFLTQVARSTPGG
jgi:hypothetical protein